MPIFDRVDGEELSQFRLEEGKLILLSDIFPVGLLDHKVPSVANIT